MRQRRSLKFQMICQANLQTRENTAVDFLKIKKNLKATENLDLRGLRGGAVALSWRAQEIAAGRSYREIARRRMRWIKRS
jgi:hypothetical protein